MSLSINGYTRQNYFSILASQQQMQSQSPSQADASGTETAAPARRPLPPIGRNPIDSNQEPQGDTVQFSPELLQYWASEQGENAESTGTYSPAAIGSTLTAEQKKSMLYDLQAELGTLDSSAASEQTPPGLAELLAKVKGELSGFDASTASEEEVSELFDEIAETFDSARPPQPPGGQGGIPPMLQAMGGIAPPFMLDGTAAPMQPNEEHRPPMELTVDQKKEFLSGLQASLQSIDEEDGSTLTANDDESTTNMLSLLRSSLENFDASRATDSEITELFDSIAQML